MMAIAAMEASKKTKMKISLERSPCLRTSSEPMTGGEPHSRAKELKGQGQGRLEGDLEWSDLDEQTWRSEYMKGAGKVERSRLGPKASTYVGPCESKSQNRSPEGTGCPGSWTKQTEWKADDGETTSDEMLSDPESTDEDDEVLAWQRHRSEVWAKPPRQGGNRKDPVLVQIANITSYGSLWRVLSSGVDVYLI